VVEFSLCLLAELVAVGAAGGAAADGGAGGRHIGFVFVLILVSEVAMLFEVGVWLYVEGMARLCCVWMKVEFGTDRVCSVDEEGKKESGKSETKLPFYR
jgi:hypothetical protein